jgi:hypothetical protein
MGRRESMATPSVRTRAAAERARQDFRAIRLEIKSLLQEARALREEACAIRVARHALDNQLERQGLLSRQASLCCMRALETLRAASSHARFMPHLLGEADSMTQDDEPGPGR